MFDAIVISKEDDQQSVALRQIAREDLPEGDVLVEVAWSTLNYKDAQAITGAAPVVRSFPMVPGIDLSGIVRESADPRYNPGDRVVLNGWSVGEKHWGGLARFARLKGDWLVPLPDGVSLRQAMEIGTAGYTAQLCVSALLKAGLTPEAGEVVVTGAAGGVGSIAVALFAAKGFTVCAVTGRAEEEAYLRSLGASQILPREEFAGKPRPLDKGRFAGAVDVAGSTVLANVISKMKYRGLVAACGLAAGMDLPSSVAPFILRGVSLLGVDSVMVPRDERIDAWAALAKDLDMGKLAAIAHEMALEDVIAEAPKFLEGKIRGRVVVPLNAALA